MPSDALSLGLLATGGGGLQDFYRRAYLAVCRGLELRNPERALTWLAGDDLDFADAEARPPRELSLPFQQLIRLRRAMVEYCDEWGTIIEGDLWGQRRAEEPLRASLNDAKRWYWDSRHQLLAGLSVFDPPLLSMLGWDEPVTVAYAVLLRDFAYPSSDEVLP